MRLSHNMFSLSIYNTYKNRIDDNSKALNNISTGIKLNSAKDNPNKIGKNETLKIQILTNDAASKNVQDANSMIQTFDGALQEMNNSLCRMKELEVSAGSGTLSNEDIQIIQGEMDSLTTSINNLAKNTKFNGISLSYTDPISSPALNENPTKIIETAIGTMNDEKMDIPIFDVSTKNLGIDTLIVANTDVSIAAIDKATGMINNVRSRYGSIQNRLEGAADYLSNKESSIQSVQSRIGDADIAEEMIQYSKSQVLIQASIGLLAQSNNFPKDALNILSNVK